MHVERSGGPPDLQAAFARFVLRVLKGRLLDDNKDEEAKRGKFPDFACFRDLVLIEMKHLESEQNDRVNDTYKKKVLPDEEPLFFGRRRVDLARLSNGDEIRSAILNKLSQTIETHLRKANQQFEGYRARNPRKNSLSICLLLNSQVDEFSPDVVMHSVKRKLKSADGSPRFRDIDAVVFISEKHFQQLPDGRPAFAIMVLICASAIEQYWKMKLIDVVTQKWSEFRIGQAPVPGRPDQFKSVEDVPASMRQHEAWKIAYKRNPYLSTKTDQELKIHFHRCVALNSLGFVNGSWLRPTQDEITQGIRRFGDAIEEINRRGIDMRQFSPRTLSREEQLEAYAGLPEELIQILSGQRAA